MKFEQLFEQCENVLDSPEAIQRLRKFILDMAVRGRLVKQDPDDEVDLKLLKFKDVELSDSIPSWVYSSVGNLLDFKYGKGKKKSDCLSTGPIPVYGSNGIMGYCEMALTNNPVIVVGRKGSAGALNLCTGPSWTTDVAYYVESPGFFNIQFLFFSLQALSLETLAKGVKPGLSRSDAYKLSLSIPPFREQHRIVAKVDDMMARCDQLEEKFNERKLRRKKFTIASFASLNEHNLEPVAFKKRTEFVIQNFVALTQNIDQIKSLRQAIMDMAVRGKLVKQDLNDGHGADLKKRIRVSWNERLGCGEIKKIEKWAELAEKDIPFDIPQTWGLTRLGEVIELINGRAFKPSDWSPRGLPIVRIQNLNNPNALFNHFDGEVESKFLIDSGDFLISWSGTPGTSFGAHIWKSGRAVLNQHIFKAVLLAEVFEKRFLKIAINSRLLELIEQAHGSAGLRHITKPKLEAVVLTLPPLPEQHRIVAKVNELMAHCDQLEEKFNERESSRQTFLEAVLHEHLTNTWTK